MKKPLWFAFALVAILAAASVQAQTQSCRSTTKSPPCLAWSSGMLGACPDGYALFNDVCPAATPTPPPVAQYTYTVTQFLKAGDLGYTYIQGLTMFGGVLWGNGGVCCPAIGEGIGECVFSIDYTQNPPVFREWWCTNRDTVELWESCCIQADTTDRWPISVAGVSSRRPPFWPIEDNSWDGQVWGIGAPSISAPWFSPATVHRDAITITGGRPLPLGWIVLRGHRWLYGQLQMSEGAWPIARWDWSDISSWASWSGDAVLTAAANEPPLFSGIVLDTDGSLLATTGWWPAQNNVVVDVWRSRDEGRTWAKTGYRFEAPGRTLFGCGWEHKPGGAAVVPWHLTCTIGTGLGPDMGDWHAADIRVNGATVPASWGKVPVKWVKP